MFTRHRLRPTDTRLAPPGLALFETWDFPSQRYPALFIFDCHRFHTTQQEPLFAECTVVPGLGLPSGIKQPARQEERFARRLRNTLSSRRTAPLKPKSGLNGASGRIIQANNQRRKLHQRIAPTPNRISQNIGE